MTKNLTYALTAIGAFLSKANMSESTLDLRPMRGTDAVDKVLHSAYTSATFHGM